MSAAARSALLHPSGANLPVARSVCVASFLLGAASLFAQQPLPPQPDPTLKPYVLHVYTNLMQIPALVLDSHDRPATNVDPKRFAVSLDYGPRFRPAFVRMEGDDAISLTILLDLSGDTAELLHALRDAIPAVVPAALNPRDHVSLYALDCSLVRSADDVPANAQALATAIDLAEARLHPSDRFTKHKPSPCSDNLKLWDSLALISKELSTRPGRRMVLVVTVGKDAASKTSWSDLHLYAATNGVAIFALELTDAGPFMAYQPMDYLHLVCDLSGGLALNIFSSHQVARTLPRFFELMRGRYILEFHRPNKATSGLHDVAVTLDKSSDRINVGGVTVAIARPEELADPNDAETTERQSPHDPHP